MERYSIQYFLLTSYRVIVKELKNTLMTRRKIKIYLSHFLLFLFVLLPLSTWTQPIPKGPDRIRGEGPFDQLIIRGVTLINGNGAPPIGPVDIVVEQHVITAIKPVGYPGVPIDDANRPQLKAGGKELDCHGMFLMPGLIDMHAHIGGAAQGTPAEYVYKLWLSHGITTVREVMSRNGLDWTLEEKKRSAKNEITAPRIFAYMGFSMKDEGGRGTTPSSPEEARKWVQRVAAKGADGVKFRYGPPPAVMEAALKEITKLGLRSAAHHDQMSVAQWNVLHSAKLGLTSMEHWYGLPEALFDDKTVQDYSLNYNYSNEQDRFGEAGLLWLQAAKPGSEKWNQVMDELIALDFTMVPTFNIYEASRDLHRARRAEWHEAYTLPSLWRFYMPSKISHGSYWHYWTTEKEIQWRKNYDRWMLFINEYKNKGGRVAAGSDSGFIYQLYGFSYIRELELLREAGFHPLEVLMSATLKGAEALGMDDKLGSIQVGKLADFAILQENPLENLKILYGTGAIKLTDDNEVIRTTGIQYTIKDGIIYDAKQLLADVKAIVEQSKRRDDFELVQPGQKGKK